MCVQSSHTPSILARYEAWVRSNSTWVRSIEDTLRTVVLFMPGRFGDAEVQSQSIYTAVDLLSFYHDHILRRPRVTLQCGVDSAHTRTAKALITAVQYTEILIEMIATRRLTRDQRWLLIVLIEAVKTLSRLFLLIHNHGHVLVLGADEQPREAEIHTEAAAGRLPTDTPFRDILQLYASHGTRRTHKSQLAQRLCLRDLLSLSHSYSCTLRPAAPIIHHITTCHVTRVQAAAS